MKKILLFIFALSVFQFAQAQQTPAPEQSGAIMVVGATAHIGNGTVIENSAIGFDKGKITFIGKASEANQAGHKVIDAKGKHVYPGLIGGNTSLGLVEIEAVRSTRDNAEVGAFNPSIRSVIAYNTDSRVTPTVRSNGVLMVQVVPSGGWISGQSSIVELDGWNWEDASYKTDDGIWMAWPQPYARSGWWAEPGGVSANKKYQEQIRTLKDFFKDAKSYIDGEPKVKNLKFEAMRGLFDGSKQLFIKTNYVKAIMSAVEMAEEFGVKYVIVGGQDAWQMTDYLKKHNTRIMLSKTQRLPNRDHEDVDQAFKTPVALQKAGIEYCIMFNDAWQVRNLPFQAGQAVPFGLSKEEALSSVSLNVAKILGIDKTVGSLEKGKDATLVVSNGDILDPLTNQVTHAFIQGKAIDLDNKQKKLYRKFKAKYAEEK
ncbi:MAG: amidohydrolase family protein [Saprospiraceae bacterium]